MKKLLLTIATFLYLMVSTGFSIELHYCMGKFAGFDFHNTQNEKCGRCGMTEKKGGCCNDETRFFKLNDNFKNSHSAQICFEGEAQLPPIAIQVSDGAIVISNFSSYAIPVNPIIFGPPLFIRNRVFRI